MAGTGGTFGGGSTFGKIPFAGSQAATAVPYTLALDAGSYTYTGVAQGLTYNRTISLVAGSYTLTGNAQNFYYGYFCSLGAGSYTYTGVDTLPHYGRSLSLAAGSYTLTGASQNFYRGIVIPLAAGSYSLSGQAVTLAHGYNLSLAAGSYTLTGVAQSFTYARTISLTAGTYTLTGVSTLPHYGRSLSLAAGSYTLTGVSQNFYRGIVIPLAAGSYTLSGQAVTLAHGYNLSLAAGSYSLTGVAQNFYVGKLISLGAGSYTLSGQALTLHHNYTISLTAGSYTLTGVAANLSYDPAGNFSIFLEQGAYNLTGVSVGVQHAYAPITLSSGSYTLSGKSVTLAHGYNLSLSAGSYTYSGVSVSLTYARTIALGAGSYTYTGVALGLTRAYAPISLGTGEYTLVSGSYWDYTIFPANLRASNGNRVVTQTSGGNYYQARGNTARGGKRVFRLYDTTDGSNPGIGIFDATAAAGDINDSTSHWIGWNSHSIGFYSDGAWYNGSQVLAWSGLTTGHFLDVAIDWDAKLVWFRFDGSGNWNNSGSADPATGTGGISVSGFDSTGYYGCSVGGTNGKITYDPNPAVVNGFLAWDAQQGVSITSSRKIGLASGLYTQTGVAQGLTYARTLNLNTGSYVYTGVALSLVHARTLALSGGSYAVTGKDVGLTYDPFTQDYSLALDAGSYTYTGNSVTLHYNRTISLGAGTYNYLSGGNVEEDIEGGNDLTISGATTVDGYSGSGLLFDGTNDYCDIPQAAIGSWWTEDRTLSVRFKTTTNGPLVGQTVTGQTPGSSSPGGYIPALYVDTNGKLRGTLFWHGAVATVVSTTTVNDGNWHTATITYDSGVETLYVDGVQEDQRSGLSQSDYGSGSYQYYLGSAYASGWTNFTSGGWDFFEGTMDDLRVYNVALSSSDVASLHAGGEPAGLIANYPMGGQAVTLTYAQNKSLLLDSGVYTVTGKDLTISRGITVSLGAGSYTYTGVAQDFVRTVGSNRAYNVAVVYAGL